MDPFVAEIRIVPFNFAPKGWAFCNGQLIPISQNTALFSLLGTFYGGDGKSTFALPNLQGYSPMHTGQGQGLSQRFLGEQGGSETVTLDISDMPAHSHSFSQSVRPSDGVDPEGLALGTGNNIYATAGNFQPMAPEALTPVGGSLPHNNMMPYLTCSFVICLQGVYPSRG